MEFVSMPLKDFNARDRDVSSVDFPPLNPLAASDRLRMLVAIPCNFCVSTFKLSRRLFMLAASFSKDLLASAALAFTLICRESRSAILPPTSYNFFRLATIFHIDSRLKRR